MMTCPFCHFENEDGALFCEQCKSDLAGAVPIVSAEPIAAVPVEAIAVAAEGLTAVPIEAVPVMAEPVPVIAEAVPMLAEPMPVVAEAMPVMAEAMPVVAEAVPVEPSPVIAEAAPVMPMTEPIAAVPMMQTPALAMTEPVAAVPAAVAATPVPAQPAAAPAAPASAAMAIAGQPRLLVLRGLKRNVEYPIYDGLNFIGRADDKPVDIDLEDQEPPDRIWCSRQHACISLENGVVEIEDLNSANGTYVNRQRIYPGQKRPLAVNDIVQIGNVQLKVIA